MIYAVLEGFGGYTTHMTSLTTNPRGCFASLVADPISYLSLLKQLGQGSFRSLPKTFSHDGCNVCLPFNPTGFSQFENTLFTCVNHLKLRLSQIPKVFFMQHFSQYIQ